MNSRQMERLEAAASGPEATRSEVSAADADGALRTLLRGRPERLMLIGRAGGASLAEHIRSYRDLDALGTADRLDLDAPFNAAVADGPARRLAQDAARLGELLTDDGRLVLLAGADSAEDAPAALRELVRAISEAGFVPVREGALPAALRNGSDAGGVLVARRDPYRVRAYTAGDEDAILELFPACFFTRRSLEHWQWKYRDNPWGKHYLSMAFAADGTLASHYGGYPMPFWIDGKDFLALQMGDTMTHPEHREVGRGKTMLLGRAVRHFFTIHRDGPFGFFYGFNTGAIQRFCSWFIGGSRVEPVGFWVAEPPEHAPAWERSGYRVERIQDAEAVDASFDRLFRRAAPHYEFLVRRDARYLRWRYLDCPDVDEHGEKPFAIYAARRWGRLVGWCVFRRREGKLIWGDALFDRRHARAARALLAAAHADHPEISRVEGWFAERPAWWRAQLEKLGFARRDEPNALGFMVLPDNAPDAAARLPELYYTMGDGDLF